jgi:methionyl-tRNA synthetase
VVARYQRLIRGEANPTQVVALGSVFFLTGTDEHADKVVTSAAANNATPLEWADRNAEEFKKAFAFMNISNNDFIRTTEARHKSKVPGYIKKLMASGDIYKGEYTGWYDAGQEEYVTETAARDANFISAINKQPLVKRTEPCYFFRLGKYQQKLLELVGGSLFVQPDARRQEVLGRLKPPQVLNDIPVSRPVTDDPATQWGIRIPGDDAHRIYVWIDALFNYLSVVDNPEQRKFWPANVHLIGKDILWFHAVIWPALLMALNEPLPRMVFGHGWWISEGQKMSKSLGNFIDLEKLKAYAAWAPNKEGIPVSLDALRWYLATQGPLSGQDSDFSHAKFVEIYNAHLANGIGNCTSRVGNMVEKYFGGVLPAPASSEGPAASIDWKSIARGAHAGAIKSADAIDISASLLRGIEIVGHVDGYINTTQPFKVAKLIEGNPGAKADLATILYNCAEALRIATILLSPAMPQKMAQLWHTWNCVPAAGATLVELCEFGGKHALKTGQKIAKGEPLFMRADGTFPAPAA